jgi:serpin B
MAYNGAASQTATNMQTTLGYGGMSKEDINQACKDLSQILQSCDPNVILNIANSIWYRNTILVRDSFLNLNRTYFNAEVTAADFNSQQTVTQINKWVGDKTNGKITSIVTTIPPDLVMYLINAIYFKGTWKYEFNPKNTTKNDFTLIDGTVYSTDFMTQTGEFKYYENDLFTSISLPYGNGNFNMVAFVPKTGSNYQTILDNLTESNWNFWNEAFQSITDMHVYLPKFKFEFESNLNEVLSSMGMAVAFDPINANFSGIDGGYDLYISEVKHKTYIEVNESGTEAAAVTSIGITSEVMRPNEFRANKPFIFAIKENTTNNILFIGLILKPIVQ